HGFHADVVESVNVHESIKLGDEHRDRYIENYKQTIRNLSEYGIKVICYNFMPIFDWTRTDLAHELEDGSTALFYENKKIDSVDQIELFKSAYDSTSLSLPGCEPEKLDQIKSLFKAYEVVTADILRENLVYFLQEILPVCEECDVKMAIHPDDPPWSIFGLPSIITGEADLENLLDI